MLTTDQDVHEPPRTFRLAYPDGCAETVKRAGRLWLHTNEADPDASTVLGATRTLNELLGALQKGATVTFP